MTHKNSLKIHSSMKTSKQYLILISSMIVLLLVTCTKKEADNPFDAGCPKELFTPANFKSEMSGTSVKLSWTQENLTINGFVINRSDNGGTAAEVARVDKSTLTWTDTKVSGGTKYDYIIYAYAGANQSNPMTSTITTPALGPVVTTNSAATGITSSSAVLGGNVTSNGGSAVTARGICYATTQSPTTASSKVASGSGNGEFSATLTSLAANTTYYARAYATNSYGTSYGTEVSFTTSQMLAPTVATSSAISITAISVVLGGNVTNDGNSTVTENGICYSTTENPTTANTKVAIGSGTGSFSKTVEGLKEGTTYYVRAYAINSIGTSYGTQISFTTTQLLLPTVTTADATTIAATTVVLGGNVTNDGNATVTERGVCYSTSQNPTTGNTKLAIGSGTGVFSNTITGLTPNTTYYARAYAINSKGTAYGSQVTFKTIISITLATLSTTVPTILTNNSATMGGTITDDGNATVTDRGICYATTQNPTTANNKVSMGNGIGAFSNTITGLVVNTTYYVRAYAVNSQGTAYGNQISFVASVGLPTLTTKDVTNILETTAVAGGIVLTDEGASVTERGVCYGTTTNPTIYDSKLASGSGTGGFNIALNTLIPNTTYYVRAYATNKNGTAYGENKTFKTADAYYAGFENGLPTGWTGNWTVSSDSPYEGFYCLKSVNNGDVLEFTTTITTTSGGQISYYHRGVNCCGYAKVHFYIDNVLQYTSGGEGWTIHSFPINSGKHTFKWVSDFYNYDNPTNYIDYVICPK